MEKLDRRPEGRRLAAQDPHARGVERGHPHAARGRPDQLLDALAHLRGGLVGERDREDLARARPAAWPAGTRCGGSSTRVLPEPAPATISSGPPWCSTASRCWGFRPAEQGVGLGLATGAALLGRSLGSSSEPGRRRGARPDGRTADASRRRPRGPPGTGGREVLEERRHGPSRIGAAPTSPCPPVDAAAVTGSATQRRRATRAVVHEGRRRAPRGSSGPWPAAPRRSPATPARGSRERTHSAR